MTLAILSSRVVSEGIIARLAKRQVAGVSTDRPYHTDRPRPINTKKDPKDPKIPFRNQYKLTSLYDGTYTTWNVQSGFGHDKEIIS